VDRVQVLADANEEIAIRRYVRSMHRPLGVHVCAVACGACGRTQRVDVRAGVERVTLVCPHCRKQTMAWIEVPDAS
jgi:hypothetical protein